MNRLCLLTLFCVLASSAAHAQFTLDARLSETNASYLIGYAGDIGQNSYLNNENQLLLSDTTSLVGTQTVSGFYPPTNNHWTGTATWNIQQQYAVTGTLANATKLEASGSSVISGTAQGCTTEVASLNPGSVYTVDFSLSSPRSLRFRGTHFSDPPANLNTAVTFGYVWNGSGWSTFLVKFPNTTWDEVLNLNAGSYRFVTQSTAKTSGTDSKSASWNYTLEALIQVVNVPLNFEGGAAVFDAPRSMRYTVTSGTTVIASNVVFTGASAVQNLAIPLPIALTGPVQISIDGAQYLRRRFTATLTGVNQVLPTQLVRPGDVNNDGEVDLTDIDAIIGDYLGAGGSVEGSVTDQDNNGEVDLTDLDLAIGNYLFSDDV